MQLSGEVSTVHTDENILNTSTLVARCIPSLSKRLRSRIYTVLLLESHDISKVFVAHLIPGDLCHGKGSS